MLRCDMCCAAQKGRSAESKRSRGQWSGG